MTNEEKFRAGTVVYKDDDGDYGEQARTILTQFIT